MQFPEVGELLLHRLLKQWVRAFKRNDKPVILAVSKFVAHLTNQQVWRAPRRPALSDGTSRPHRLSDGTITPHRVRSRVAAAALCATRAASRILALLSHASSLSEQIKRDMIS